MGSLVKPVGSLVGLGPDHGEYLQNPQNSNKSLDTLNGMGALDVNSNDLAQNVKDNSLLGKTFAQGGLQDQNIGDIADNRTQLQNLQNQGFQLTPEDQTLYGQTSGNIARLFGQQDQATAQNMADRGFGAGGGGAAAVSFSGNQGNKNEMLAQAQQQIMQQRFQNTQNQIAQRQQYNLGLNNQAQGYNNQAEGAMNDQFGRNVAQRDDLRATGNLQNQTNAMSNNANLQGLASKKGAYNNNFGDAASQGMFAATSGSFLSGGGTTDNQKAPGGGSPVGQEPANTYGSGYGLGSSGKYNLLG